jgi:hypothetical protein
VIWYNITEVGAYNWIGFHCMFTEFEFNFLFSSAHEARELNSP